MPIDSFNQDSVWRPFGAFSVAVVQGSGQVGHMKGQVSLNRAGNIVGEGAMEKQVKQALENSQSV